MSRESDERAYHEKRYLDSPGGYPPPLSYDPPAIQGGQGRTASELHISAAWLGLLLLLCLLLLSWYCVVWIGGGIA